MAEYIDREKILEHIKDLPTWWADDKGMHDTKYPKGMFDCEDVVSSIENAPAADVEHVIRCKDCKWYERDKLKGGFCRKPEASMWSPDCRMTSSNRTIIAVVPKGRRIPMAIKIIKPGKKPDTIKRFTCSRCGCVFMADVDDYEKEHILCNGYYLLIDCPTCGRIISRLRDE